MSITFKYSKGQHIKDQEKNKEYEKSTNKTLQNVKDTICEI